MKSARGKRLGATGSYCVAAMRLAQSQPLNPLNKHMFSRVSSGHTGGEPDAERLQHAILKVVSYLRAFEYKWMKLVASPRNT